jgi:hypothetical protein
MTSWEKKGVLLEVDQASVQLEKLSLDLALPSS